nr:hypothetical protein 220p1_00032 [Serratia entomophila]
MREIGYPTSGQTSNSLDVAAYGVHCDRGDASKGIPFERCYWTISGHAPSTTGHCRLRTIGRWDLDDTSNCQTDSSWGFHTGAAPGGECVLFGQLAEGATFISTPTGAIWAGTAANSGNSYCVKALAPNVKCEINLPSEIDHGVIYENEGGEGRRFIDGVVDCGGAPVVAVVGRSDFELATGVSVKVSTSMVSNTQLRVQSDIDVKSYAYPGEYSAAIVIAVSPY